MRGAAPAPQFTEDKMLILQVFVASFFSMQFMYV